MVISLLRSSHKGACPVKSGLFFARLTSGSRMVREFRAWGVHYADVAGGRGVTEICIVCDGCSECGQ